VFVGETLPGGEVADTNYLFLGSWYLDSLNARYVKPLDYTYYRSLKSPIATRLYELLGVKFYGMKAPYILYKYSTVCQLLPLTRQRYLSQAKQKMSAAHQRLTETEFLENVEWENIPGDNRDWYVKYYPGKRVGEEIQRFRQPPALAAEDSDDGVGESEPSLFPEDEPDQQPVAEPAPVAKQRKPRRKKIRATRTHRHPATTPGKTREDQCYPRRCPRTHRSLRLQCHLRLALHSPRQARA